MKYVVLIHSNPQPWGHPTSDFTEADRAIPADARAERDRQFDLLLAEITESGELVVAEALAAPESATVYTEPTVGDVLATDGPYAETKEHLAGFFLLDCATPERAEQIAVRFSSPGSTVELRPAMSEGSADS